MKIKKHGKFSSRKSKEHFEEFKCDNCGCEFSVKDDEYYRDEGTYFTTSTLTSNSVTYSWPPQDTLVCSCPECYKICKKSVTGAYKVNPVTWTCKDSDTITLNGTEKNSYDHITVTGNSILEDLKL